MEETGFCMLWNFSFLLLVEVAGGHSMTLLSLFFLSPSETPVMQSSGNYSV